MKQISIYLCACLVGLLCAAGWAQTAAGGQAGVAAAAAAVGVPRLVRFSGIVRDGDKKPVKGIVGITFALYKDQEGGAPVWLETQNAELDNSGHYTVLLGASKPEGLPSELFASGEARWLGVQVQGQDDQPYLVAKCAIRLEGAGRRDGRGQARLCFHGCACFRLWVWFRSQGRLYQS